MHKGCCTPVQIRLLTSPVWSTTLVKANPTANRAYLEGRLACLPVVCRALLTVLPCAFGLATSVAGAVALTVTLLALLLATGATLVVSLKAVEACMLVSAVLPPWDMLDPQASSYLDLQRS